MSNFLEFDNDKPSKLSAAQLAVKNLLLEDMSSLDVKPSFESIDCADLFSRLDAFLPQMKAANEALADGEGLIPHPTSGNLQVVIDVGLGVFNVEGEIPDNVESVYYDTAKDPFLNKKKVNDERAGISIQLVDSDSDEEDEEDVAEEDEAEAGALEDPNIIRLA